MREKGYEDELQINDKNKGLIHKILMVQLDRLYDANCAKKASISENEYYLFLAKTENKTIIKISLWDKNEVEWIVEYEGEIFEQVNPEVNQGNNNQPEDQDCNICQLLIIELFNSYLLNARAICTNLISLDTLKQGDIDYDVNLNKFYIDFQIISIIELILNVNISTKYFKNSNAKEIKYTWIFKYRVHSRGDFLYIIMIASDIIRLFYCYLALCDNEKISIGTFICILSPHSVEKICKTFLF